MDCSLPFPRGETYFYGNTSAAIASGSTGPANRLVGREFLTNDSFRAVGKGHGTGQKIRLKVLRNNSGGDLKRHRGGVRPSTAAGTANGDNLAAGYVNIVGGKGYVIDDAYDTGYNIADDDLFYVVIEGPCDVKHTSSHETSATDLDQGKAVWFNTYAQLVASASEDMPAVSGGVYVIGRFASGSPTSTISPQQARIDVKNYGIMA